MKQVDPTQSPASHAEAAAVRETIDSVTWERRGLLRRLVCRPRPSSGG